MDSTFEKIAILNSKIYEHINTQKQNKYTTQKCSTMSNANIDAMNVNSHNRYIIYPKNYENIEHINNKDKFKILNYREMLENLFDKIWDYGYNKNYFKTLESSQVFFFFNFTTIYNSLHDNYAYNHFFSRMIEILYEFIYDIYMEKSKQGNILSDDVIILYISKIRKIEKDGYGKYLNILKDKFNKPYRTCDNKYSIKQYEKLIFSANLNNTSNNTEEYIEMRNYIKIYNKKKTQINEFVQPYISQYDKLIGNINKKDFASLYQIPHFLQE